jgi:hypothetical protein
VSLGPLDGDLLSHWIESAIPGSEDLVAWFGDWPSFHDAEVLELSFLREGSSSVRIHTWRMTSEIDPTGHVVADRHVIVSFWFEEIVNLELVDFSVQNVISGLVCEKSEEGFKVTMSPCFGVAGYIEAKRVSVTFEPGEPKQ